MLACAQPVFVFFISVIFASLWSLPHKSACLSHCSVNTDNLCKEGGQMRNACDAVDHAWRTGHICLTRSEYYITFVDILCMFVSYHGTASFFGCKTPPGGFTSFQVSVSKVSLQTVCYFWVQLRLFAETDQLPHIHTCRSDLFE